MSSEDPTKNLSRDTQPTIQTILERLAAIEGRLNVRLDRIESEVKQTHSEFYALRADFTELRNALREAMPQLR